MLVAVSLATQAEPLAKLKGLTFATLDEGYRLASDKGGLFPFQIAATAVLAIFTAGLWFYFA